MQLTEEQLKACEIQEITLGQDPRPEGSPPDLFGDYVKLRQLLSDGWRIHGYAIHARSSFRYVLLVRE